MLPFSVQCHPSVSPTRSSTRPLLQQPPWQLPSSPASLHRALALLVEEALASPRISALAAVEQDLPEAVGQDPAEPTRLPRVLSFFALRRPGTSPSFPPSSWMTTRSRPQRPNSRLHRRRQHPCRKPRWVAVADSSAHALAAACPRTSTSAAAPRLPAAAPASTPPPMAPVMAPRLPAHAAWPPRAPSASPLQQVSAQALAPPALVPPLQDSSLARGSFFSPRDYAYSRGSVSSKGSSSSRGSSFSSMGFSSASSTDFSCHDRPGPSLGRSSIGSFASLCHRRSSIGQPCPHPCSGSVCHRGRHHVLRHGHHASLNHFGGDSCCCA
mmetsp:Transcript_35156/g.100984  ORF Transcript_35156/g.100984 Transcript_35156/m.100984 type:complete len:326 (+) Transcript_35156:1856-2833(+)